MIRHLLLLAICVVLYGCTGSEITLPKPRIYPRIDFPDKTLKLQVFGDCPYEMHLPHYFNVLQDTFYSQDLKNECWYDLYCKEFNAYLHLSYIDIINRKHFDSLIQDAFELADKHNIKANYRDEIRINKADQAVHGIIFEIDGPVATPLQFFVTDSTSHFMRGSLYFKSQVNRDSIAPIYDFLRDDILSLIDSYKWIH